MTTDHLPAELLRFDPTSELVIDPQRNLKRDPAMPEACVLCFFQDAIAARVVVEQAILVLAQRLTGGA